jgi:hypothetical protein
MTGDPVKAAYIGHLLRNTLMVTYLHILLAETTVKHINVKYVFLTTTPRTGLFNHSRRLPRNEGSIPLARRSLGAGGPYPAKAQSATGGLAAP